MAEIIYAGDGGVFKTCSKCGEAKAFSDFNLSKSERTGLRCECRSCQIAIGQAYRENNLEKERARSRLYHKKNPDAATNRNREWRAKNRVRATARDTAWKRKNKDKAQRWAKRYYERKKSDPQFRLEASIKVGVYSMLNGTKSYRPTFKILGYSIEELRSHLESRFLPGMTWENYGFYGWHVDHIRPRSSFRYSSPDDPEFKKAWALENLQPLWASENKRKGAKLNYGCREVGS